MAMESAAKFFEIVSNDETLKSQLETASKEDVIELGKAKGLDFTMEEFKKVISQVSAQKEKGESQLSDEDLEQVAGGFGICAGIGAVAGAVSLACAIDGLADEKGWW